MKYITAIALAVLVFGFSGCAPKSAAPLVPDPAHTSQNALDWDGLYQGTIPSAGGSGITINLRLAGDHTYVLNVLYIDKSSTTYTSLGTFTWDESGQIISLEQDREFSFFVGENVLFLLDQEKQRITGPLEEHYRLYKQ